MIIGLDNGQRGKPFSEPMMTKLISFHGSGDQNGHQKQNLIMIIYIDVINGMGPCFTRSISEMYMWV